MTSKSRIPASVEDNANPEWTEADFACARPGHELPAELLAAFPKTRRPGERGAQKTPTKKPVSIRLDPQVIEHFKAGGAGWQSRINDALVKAISKSAQR